MIHSPGLGQTSSLIARRRTPARSRGMAYSHPSASPPIALPPARLRGSPTAPPVCTVAPVPGPACRVVSRPRAQVRVARALQPRWVGAGLLSRERRGRRRGRCLGGKARLFHRPFRAPVARGRYLGFRRGRLHPRLTSNAASRLASCQASMPCPCMAERNAALSPRRGWS